MNFKARTMVCVGIFSIAMAVLESAVVVYLRALYYPEGFTVAFKLIDEDILKVELLREIATLVMLLAIGYLSGHNFKSRFAYFLLSFAVWDIFYYAWLKILINWPASLLQWDILFLIPITWVSPVLAPIVCSLVMMILAFGLLRSGVPIASMMWPLLLAGSGVILYTFMQDYGRLIVEHGLLSSYPNLLNNPDFVRTASGFEPDKFNWTLFWAGIILLVIATGRQFRTLRKDHDMEGRPDSAAAASHLSEKKVNLSDNKL